MNYENTPRPELENHPHIRMLIETQEKKTKDRNLHRDKDKELAERQEEIDRYKPVDIIEFWCEECKEDFAHLAYKQVETDWSNTAQEIAFYRECTKTAALGLSDTSQIETQTLIGCNQLKWLGIEVNTLQTSCSRLNQGLN